jgi:xanthine dehydrogenase accessory factor
MNGWLEALNGCMGRGEACVIVTVASVRGHAPRAAGAKMIVSSQTISGSVGGGNLEEVAIRKSRTMLEARTQTAETLELTLTERAPAEFGVQCCGGEVTLLLEPVQPELTQIALFGMGHVGLALARILCRLPFELLLCDSRPEMLEPTRIAELSSAANVRTFSFDHPSPEFVFAELRAGAFVFILTHDHREDITILETALHRPDLAYVGLIGSSAKWSRFQVQLQARGFTNADFARVTTPIGVAGVRGKHPEVIAIAAAAQILERVKILDSSS